MAGPAEVSFPGDKNRRKKIRVRGIKQASKQIQQRLERNLEALLEDPSVFIPTINTELGKPRRDPMAATIKEISQLSAKRYDRRWLSKRMVKRRGDIVCRALAGCLLAALEDDHTTVSVFKNPIYGSSSFIRRGTGKQSHMVGIQNYKNPKLRLLVFDEHAKHGLWFFSWNGGFVYTGNVPKVPDEWVHSTLDSASIQLNGTETRWTRGLDEKTVENDERTDAGWLKLNFQNGTTIGLSQSSLAKSSEAFVPSIALNMIPPKLSEIAEAEWMWRPDGWPKDRELPPDGREQLDGILLAWMSMALEDTALARACRASILNSIDDGFVASTSWFAQDCRGDFLEHLSGTANEKQAIEVILDSLDRGIHVRADGQTFNLESDVVRFEDSACHPILTSLWPEHGELVLEEIFKLTGDDAEVIHQKQMKRKQGFGAFFKELGATLSINQRLDRLPWKNNVLPSPLIIADKLVRKAADDGIAATVAIARKGKGLDSAMGWAWLVVQDRTESDSWRFDSSSRDKGSDWVPALQALWDAGEDLLLKDNLDAVEDYKVAMRRLAEVTGSKLSQ
jgi:hypothetical protein|tara:strand:- start:725 stop:2416 length:1692 start_codon:yes stop_codon:yes gene_type:complete